jgi:GNAT superfamily N-acetyltransferase
MLLGVVVIRQAESHELEQLHELEVDYCESGESHERLNARYASYPSLFVVAVLDGEVVGEVSGFPRREEVNLKAISVLHRHQRRGIGRRLLAVFEEGAAGYADTVNLASGEEAEQFYLACGYRPRSLLVGAVTAHLPADYRATEFPITGERVEGERTRFYVDAPTYDPRHKEAVRARFAAAGVNYIFVKRVR